MALEISSVLLARLLSDARASPDREVCGLLLGREPRIAAAEACANVASDPRRAFEIDPAALIAAYRRARGDGPPVLGYWHSHPIGDAVPSQRDAADAAPDGRIWLIVTSSRATAWRTRVGDLRQRFAAVDLRIV